ncbi:hypothetical protein CR513_49482, partial [Mucuna pruriens]
MNACIIVNLFFKEVVRLHGLHRTFVFDKDSKPLNHFWRTLWSKLGTKLFGQTKVTNRTLTQLLRSFVGKSLRSWEDWLPHFEFAYNCVVNSTTTHTPFELVYGFHPLKPPPPLMYCLCLMLALCLTIMGLLKKNLLKNCMLNYGESQSSYLIHYGLVFWFLPLNSQENVKHVDPRVVSIR